MSTKRKALELVTAVLKSGIRLAGKRASQLSAHLSEQLAPIVEQEAGIGTLKFFCPGTGPEWRARMLLTKEPETIEWINGFDKTDVLWDIGANVGVFSLYAALRGVSVYAFEPAPGNFYLLSRNIELNGFDERIASFCIAFNDASRIDTFYMANTDLGGAMNTFGQSTDWQGQPYTAKVKQSMLGFSIDDFVRNYGPLFPNHMKIDVDGIEKKIVDGAAQTLSDKRLRSVLVELNVALEDCSEVIGAMKTHGLVLHKREHAPEVDSGPYSSVFNHIFVRVA